MQFKLPEVGEGVYEVEFIKWHVQEGEIINYDQPLCEVMTDKANVEIPSSFQGKVIQLCAKEGDILKIGHAILHFEENHALAQEETPAFSSSSPSEVSHVFSSFEKVESQIFPNRVLATPSTRKFAREKGVSLNELGEKLKRRVTKEDVIDFLGKEGEEKKVLSPSLPPSFSGQEQVKRVAFRGLRKKISEKMRLSKDKAVHFTYVEEAEVTHLVELRKKAKKIAAQKGIKFTYLPFIMKSMVAALKQYPILNASLDEEREELVYKNDYHIGLSVHTEDGLVVPVIKDVEKKTLFELAKDIEEKAKLARSKKLSLEDLQGGTITLTNIGSIGGLFATPIIHYPEVAILGFNKIFRQPVVKIIDGKEQVVIRDKTYFSISLDHRVIDGAVGAEFMKLFLEYIENPNLLLLDNF